MLELLELLELLALLIALLFAIDALDIADETLLDEAEDELRGSALDCVASPADEPPQDTKLSESANTPNNKLSFITLVQCTLIHVVHDQARAGVVFPVRWCDQCVSMVQKLSTRLGFLYPPASQVSPSSHGWLR
ncbi:MAG TPA: hypothetical protein VF433_00235 [Cellvibrio sp.]